MLVERKVFTLPSFTTVSGKTIPDVRVGYETYGTLNEARDNAILVCHYFTGNAHAAGRYSESDALPGWWDAAIGPGKTLDTNRYFIISSDSIVNVCALDGKTVTTGPISINPETGKPYGLDFPVIQIADMVRVQHALVKSLNIEKLVAVAGPSAGSVQALQWSVEFPEMAPRVLAVISPGLSFHPYLRCLADSWARPIRQDPAWKNGAYLPSEPPLQGLKEAFRAMTLSSLSYDFIANQFGDAPADPAKSPAESVLNEYRADAAITALANARAALHDANHFLYMARAGQLYSIENRLQTARAKYLFVPVESDQVSPPRFSDDAAKRLREAGCRAEVALLHTAGGHLDGLTQLGKVQKEIQDFLASD